MTGHYRRFIKNYSQMAIPLTELTKEKNPFFWGPEAESAFITLRQAMIQEPVLKLPDFNKIFLIRPDASDDAIGAALLQEHECTWHPVAYFSRKLTDPQKNWSIWEKEAYALVSAVQHWDYYLSGQKFQVQTDNSVVTALMKKEPSNKRLARWILTLQEYDYDIEHIPGRANSIADVMSRDANEFETNINENMDIAREQRADSNLREIFTYLKDKILPGSDKRARYIALMSEYFIVEDDILFFTSGKGKGAKQKIVVPESLKTTILEDCHDSPTAGHFDIDRTLERIRKVYWWEGMYNDVKNYVQNCLPCARKKT